MEYMEWKNTVDGMKEQIRILETTLETTIVCLKAAEGALAKCPKPKHLNEKPVHTT